MIKPLTSLRFFFALMVFFSHIQFIEADDVILTKLYKSIFYEGYLGVSFFFMLSGFILSFAYKNKLTQYKISYKEFLIARIARIYPLHLFTLLIAIPLSLSGFFTSQVLWIGKLIINMFLLQSFIPSSSIFFSFNSPSWSISNEMFFYILFPFLISIYFKNKRTVYLSLLFLLLIPIGIFFSPENLIHRLFYINPFFRIADFILGVLLYNLYESKILENYFKSRFKATMLEFSSVGLLFLFFIFHDFIPQGYRYSVYYWIPMIIIIFSYQSGYLSEILSNRVLIILGEISFSFYLIHQLVIRYILIINTKYSLINNNYLLILVIFVVTLIASYLSYKYIELPSNKYIRSKYKKNIAVIKVYQG